MVTITWSQDILIGTVISGTEEVNGFDSKYVPKLFLHDEYNTAIENIKRSILNKLTRRYIYLEEVSLIQEYL